MTLDFISDIKWIYLKKVEVDEEGDDREKGKKAHCRQTTASSKVREKNACVLEREKKEIMLRISIPDGVKVGNK